MIRLVIFLLFFPVCHALAGVGEPFHLTVKDGLPSSTVYHAMQDSKGFMWFCTETGVCRYDGKRFQNFTINSGLADNENFRCYEDRKGRIWFLSYNGKLSYYANGHTYNPSNTPWLSYPISDGALLSCMEDKYGNLWVVNSRNEVLKVHGETVEKCIMDFHSYQNVMLNKTLFEDKGVVKKYALDTVGNVHLVDLLSMKTTTVGKIADLIRRDFSFDAGTGTKNRYVVFDKGILVTQGNRYSSIVSERYGIRSNMLSCYVEDSCVWIGTGDGLYWLNKSGTVYKKLDGHVVTSLQRDKDKGLWVTTLGNGVYLFPMHMHRTYDISAASAHSVVLLDDSVHTVVSGHANGSMVFTAEGSGDTFYVSTPRYSRILDVITLQGKDSLLICADDGVYYYNRHSNRIYPVGVRNYKNYAKYANSLWLVTPRSIEVLGNRRYAIRPAISGRMTALSVISDTEFYVGTTLGLYKRDHHKYKLLLPDTLLKAGIKDIKQIQGYIWVATHGNGIFIVRSDTLLRHISVAGEEAGSDFCEKIYDDTTGYIWIITSSGISVFDRNTIVLYRNISGTSGLVPGDLRAIYTDEQYVYAASVEGVRKIDKSTLLETEIPPQIYITGFGKGDEYTIDPGSRIEYPYFDGTVSISFISISFGDEKGIIYEYKFNNENEWHRTASNDLRFVSLKPGTHILQFRSRKHNSDWSVPVMFTIDVKPLFIQSVWFKILMAPVVLCLAYFLFMKRLAYLKKQEQKKNEADKLIAEWQSKALSCQMNPHFIFNSLNTIQQFILISDDEQGLSYIGEFATLMRQILEQSKNVDISINEEIDFLTRYLHLEQVRYDNRFTYKIEIDKSLRSEDIRIPPVMLQPLLENAIKHGVSSINGGEVQLRLRKNRHYLLGIIEDNGKGFRPDREAENRASGKRQSSALKILEARLKLTLNAEGKSGSIAIINKKEVYGTAGTIVEVTIPIL